MRLKIESWCKKFCQITTNIEWKKNRNLHAISLLDMILNNRYEIPYNKFADDGPLCLLSKTYVKSKLSKKFWKATKHIYESTSNNFIKQTMTNTRKSSSVRKAATTPSARSCQINNNINEDKGVFTVDDYNNVDILKGIIAKLQTNLNEKEQIIIKQNEEQIRLLQKIEQLEKILLSLVNQNKNNNNICNDSSKNSKKKYK